MRQTGMSAPLRPKVVGEAAIEVGHSPPEPLAEPAGIAAGMELFQIARQLVLGLARAVEHEMDPGPGVAVFVAPYVVEGVQRLKLFQTRQLSEPNRGLDRRVVRILRDALVAGDFTILG